MSEDVTFLSIAEAVGIVGAIQEEEDIQNQNKRILTVYNKDDKEICWFDYDEVIKEIGEVPKENVIEAAQDYILKHIPNWALEL
ncbi:MAG: hypothetical protein OCC45_14555 [Desulfotalea sp.]